MAQIKLNTIQIVLMANYEKLLIQIVHMAHICKNDMLQIKDMFQIVAMWLQFSTEEYVKRNTSTFSRSKGPNWGPDAGHSLWCAKSVQLFTTINFR